MKLILMFIALISIAWTVQSQTNTQYKGCKLDGDNTQVYTKFLSTKRFSYDQYTYFDRENYDISVTAPFSNDYYTQYGNCRYFSVSPSGTGKRCSVEGITFLDMNTKQLKREGDEISYTLYDSCQPINHAPIDTPTIFFVLLSSGIGFVILRKQKSFTIY